MILVLGIIIILRSRITSIPKLAQLMMTIYVLTRRDVARPKIEKWKKGRSTHITETYVYKVRNKSIVRTIHIRLPKHLFSYVVWWVHILSKHSCVCFLLFFLLTEEWNCERPAQVPIFYCHQFLHISAIPSSSPT